MYYGVQPKRKYYTIIVVHSSGAFSIDIPTYLSNAWHSLARSVIVVD